MRMADFKEIDEARKILGLEETATLREIRDAYRKLALKYHPDKCQGNRKESEEMFKKITAAYDIIMAYCAGYRYSFKKRDIEDTVKEMDEEIFRNFFDDWFGNPDL